MSVGVILENPDIDERKELLKEIIKGKEYNNLIKKLEENKIWKIYNRPSFFTYSSHAIAPDEADTQGYGAT